MSNLTLAQRERLQMLKSDAEDIASLVDDILSGNGEFTKDDKIALETYINDFLVVRLMMNQEGDIRIPPLKTSAVWREKLKHAKYQDTPE